MLYVTKGDNMSIERGNKTMRIFACGGMGTNLVSEIYDWKDKSIDGFADIEFAFVDTSNSNLSKNIDENEVYLIEGLSGSGKLRSANSDDITRRVKDVVHSFKPTHINVVVHSLNGGSGSVFGPLVTSELLQRDFPTIVVAVGDKNSRLDTNNTINTLKTYEAISRKIGIPVVMAYYQNTGSSNRKEINRFIIVLLEALRCLFSDQHHGLDPKDLYHWLRFDKVTDYPVQLSCLTLVGKDESISKVYGKAISVATLAVDGEEIEYHESVDYQTEGFITPELSKKIQSTTTHFVISDGGFDEILKILNDRIKEIDEEKDSRVVRQSLVTKDDRVEDSGLVL